MSEHTNGQIEVLCTKFYLKDVLRLHHINPVWSYLSIWIYFWTPFWLFGWIKNFDEKDFTNNCGQFYILARALFRMNMVFLCTVSSIWCSLLNSVSFGLHVLNHPMWKMRKLQAIWFHLMKLTNSKNTGTSTSKMWTEIQIIWHWYSTGLGVFIP